jgi:hypothetical protein
MRSQSQTNGVEIIDRGVGSVMNKHKLHQIAFLVIAVWFAPAAAMAQTADDPAVTLGAISITSARLHTEKSESLNKNVVGFLDRKVMSFTVRNGSKDVIKTLYFRAKLQTPGRALPWIESSHNYEFPGGLEPGESRSIDLDPDDLGEWGKVQPEWIKTGVLSISILAIDDAAGQKIEVRPPGCPPTCAPPP